MSILTFRAASSRIVFSIWPQSKSFCFFLYKISLSTCCMVYQLSSDFNFLMGLFLCCFGARFVAAKDILLRSLGKGIPAYRSYSMLVSKAVIDFAADFSLTICNRTSTRSNFDFSSEIENTFYEISYAWRSWQADVASIFGSKKFINSRRLFRDILSV